MRVIYFRGRQGCALSAATAAILQPTCVLRDDLQRGKECNFPRVSDLYLYLGVVVGTSRRWKHTLYVYCTGLHFGEILARLKSSSKFSPENIPTKCIALSTLFCILKPSLSRAEHSFHKQGFQLFDQPLNWSEGKDRTCRSVQKKGERKVDKVVYVAFMFYRSRRAGIAATVSPSGPFS